MRLNTTMSKRLEGGRSSHGAQRQRSGQLRNGKMPASFTGPIGIPAEEKHPDQARDKRNRANPANKLNILPAGKSLEHGRHPKPKGVTAGVAEEQSER